MSKVGTAGSRAVISLHQVAKPSLAIMNDMAIEGLIGIDAAIALVRQAMLDVSARRVVAPERWTMPAGSHGVMGLMPGAMPEQSRFGVKVLSLFEAPEGHAPLPGHQGLMLLFDAENGRPLCILDANALTAMRTGAASAVATDVLARRDAKTVAMIGCGEQARWHARALRSVRPINEMRVWSRSSSNARTFAAEVEDADVRVIVCSTPRDAVTGADIICTVTRSSEPVVLGDWLSPGQHINLVGSSTSEAREVDEHAVARGRFIADSRTNVLSQGGELRAAIAAGVVSPTHVHAEIGEVLAGTTPGREDENMITIYKSLGHVAQDLAVAIAIHDRADQSPHTIRAAW